MKKTLHEQVHNAVEEALQPFVQGFVLGVYMIPISKKDEMIDAIADYLCESGIFVQQQAVPLRDIIVQALLSNAGRAMASKQDLANYIAGKLEEVW